MKATECKPGMHLWMMYSYDGALEVEVLPPQEPIYQDFVWARLVDCPPGCKSPRHIRASKLYPTKKDVLMAMLTALEVDIADLQRCLSFQAEFHQREIKTKQAQSKALTKQLEELK